MMCQKPSFSVDDVLTVGWGARGPLRKLEPGGDDDLSRLKTLLPKVTDTMALYPELTCHFPSMTLETLQDQLCESRRETNGSSKRRRPGHADRHELRQRIFKRIRKSCNKMRSSRLRALGRVCTKNMLQSCTHLHTNIIPSGT